MIFFLLYVNAKRNTYRNRNHSGSHTCQCRSDATKSTQQVEIRNRKCIVCFPFLPLSSLSLSVTYATDAHTMCTKVFLLTTFVCCSCACIFFGRFFCFYLCYNFCVSSLKALFFDVFFFLSYICSLNRLEWRRQRQRQWWRATLITELRAHAFHCVILFYSLFHAPLCHTFWYRTECFTFNFAPKI